MVKPTWPGFAGWTSRACRALGDEIDAMWSTQPKVAGVLRAMLLGDRSFVEREEATEMPEQDIATAWRRGETGGTGDVEGEF